MKVFIIEKNMEFCLQLRDILSQVEGLEVVGEARSTAGIAELLTRTIPDIVILDSGTVEGNILAMLYQMKSPLIEPTVVMLTNVPQVKDRKQFTRAGADYLFVKSPDMKRMVSLLRRKTVQQFINIGQRF